MSEKVEREFIELVQDILNQEFVLGLSENQKLTFGTKMKQFDLADISNLFFVEFKFQNNSTDRAVIRNQINSLVSSLNRISPTKTKKLAIVFFNRISNNDRDFYNKNLRNLKDEKVLLYDLDDIIALAIKNKRSFDDLLVKKISSLNLFKDNRTNVNLEENEFAIEGLKNIYKGQKIGNELKDYDIFILPKSTLGGVGKNGISHSVLQILGFDPLGFSFNEKPLYPKGYKWYFRELGNKIIYIGFVFTRDENKNKIDFTDNLYRAINNLGNFKDFKEIRDKKLKVFIPLLGAGQAGMDPLKSLHTVIKGVQFLRAILPLHHIRINLPINASNKDLNDYIHHMAVALSGPPPPPPEIFHGVYNGEDEIIEPIEGVIKQEKIPFHLDQVVDEDKLGREPVARAFVDLIKKDIFTDNLNHSFMVHLQGKWGSGKSSFLNFIKNNLNSDEEDWIIVEYNAWQNQHISPPWWSLIDQVYLKSKKQLNWIACFYLWRKEVVRRIWFYSGWEKIIAFGTFLISVLCLIYFRDVILNIFNTAPVSETFQNKSFTSGFGDIVKLILSLASMVGVLFAFAKFITVPFFINSSKDAKSFMLRASDPMNQVKKHFSDLVKNINSKENKRQLAIFIDDIDRCDKEYIVQLLEGIQTLFKDNRVLYIVAGDKNWISTSFGNTYGDFVTEEVDKKQLGEFFIEKAFQLSFRLPNISEESKQDYWNHILGMKNGEVDQTINSIDTLSEEQQDELKSDLNESKSELTNPEFVKELQKKYNLSGDTASNIVIKEKNKDNEELKHLLQEYYKYIDTNPRSIIRLANNYNMARSILMAERVRFNEHKLFRWLVIEDLCPEVKKTASNTENISEFEEIINTSKDIVKRKNSIKLLKGDEEFMEGEINIEDIKTIKGI